MEDGEKRVRHEWKNVFVGRNPDTGQPYFERRKVVVRNPNDPPEEPPDMDTLPPVEATGTKLHPVKDIGIPKWLEKEINED